MPPNPVSFCTCIKQGVGYPSRFGDATSASRMIFRDALSASRMVLRDALSASRMISRERVAVFSISRRINTCINVSATRAESTLAQNTRGGVPSDWSPDALSSPTPHQSPVIEDPDSIGTNHRSPAAGRRSRFHRDQPALRSLGEGGSPPVWPTKRGILSPRQYQAEDQLTSGGD